MIGDMGRERPARLFLEPMFGKSAYDDIAVLSEKDVTLVAHLIYEPSNIRLKLIYHFIVQVCSTFGGACPKLEFRREFCHKFGSTCVNGLFLNETIGKALNSVCRSVKRSETYISATNISDPKLRSQPYRSVLHLCPLGLNRTQ